MCVPIKDLDLSKQKLDFLLLFLLKIRKKASDYKGIGNSIIFKVKNWDFLYASGNPIIINGFIAIFTSIQSAVLKGIEVLKKGRSLSQWRQFLQLSFQLYGPIHSRLNA
jgi:hypothetical protein